MDTTSRRLEDDPRRTKNVEYIDDWPQVRRR
jgi:hypothetical protein